MEEAGFRLAARHSMDMSDAAIIETHFGYSERALPCARDPLTCEYLDLVYWGHDNSMVFSGILWAIIAGVLLSWAFGRKIFASRRSDELLAQDGEKAMGEPHRGEGRIKRTVASFVSSELLPDAPRSIFGRTTRFQVAILAILVAYLTIASFAGLIYNHWIVAVPDMEGVYTIRSTLGPWSNRVGVLAYALTPLSIMLASRESILSLLTGVPYQSFNFLHRWLGYIIVVQGVLHTIGWIVIETRLYAPQPAAALQLVTERYMIWGIVATLLLLLLFVLSLPFVIRRTGYEFFRKAHYVLAMVYIGACYAHWDKLSCFMYPSLIIWFLDRVLRLIRSALVHHQFVSEGSLGFKAIDAAMTYFPDSDNGDVVRLDFNHSQDPWKIGQHFYLCFTKCSIWQSHPFTPLSLPVVRNGLVKHSYILRAKSGETKKLAALASAQLAENAGATTPLILSGSYGESIAEHLTQDVNVLCVAGGTGITYVLPVLLWLVSQPVSENRKIQLVWAIRKNSDTAWVQQELEALHQASQIHGVNVQIFVTREKSQTSSASHVEEDSKAVLEESVVDISSAGNSLLEPHGTGVSGENSNARPDLKVLVPSFVQSTIRGRTTVFGSGPGAMISDLRSAVAKCNSGQSVWRGDSRFDVGLVCDNRLE
ncbi:ferric reductase like transmembrane component-domain-containing protein [Stachybotrys elegans]|uniref:Ferric reductase like transmembrane component-domain-containing protein n=1 Tax=Stachybotrys elegans TaxID=80388 RepID=A0A8K0SSG9_9HYPO|nr:ferric reductase like transmembrane component-domain-containing protein [Stachybotrys elegans]